MIDMSCHSKEKLEQMLEDVVNELDLSAAAIAEHGPMGTPPSQLVRLVLDQKEKTIRMLQAGMVNVQSRREGGERREVMKKRSYILFDKIQSPEKPGFIEAECNGISFNCGDWEKQDDGLWRMYLNRLPELIEMEGRIKQLRLERNNRQCRLEEAQTELVNLRYENEQLKAAAKAGKGE